MGNGLSDLLQKVSTTVREMSDGTLAKPTASVTVQKPDAVGGLIAKSQPAAYADCILSAGGSPAMLSILFHQDKFSQLCRRMGFTDKNPHVGFADLPSGIECSGRYSKPVIWRHLGEFDRDKNRILISPKNIWQTSPVQCSDAPRKTFLEILSRTFAHELGHYKDWYQKRWFVFSRAALQNVTRGFSERSADQYAEELMKIYPGFVTDCFACMWCEPPKPRNQKTSK